MLNFTELTLLHIKLIYIMNSYCITIFTSTTYADMVCHSWNTGTSNNIVFQKKKTNTLVSKDSAFEIQGHTTLYHSCNSNIKENIYVQGRCPLEFFLQHFDITYPSALLERDWWIELCFVFIAGFQVLPVLSQQVYQTVHETVLLSFHAMDTASMHIKM